MDVNEAVRVQQNKNNTKEGKGKISQIVVQESYMKKLKSKIKELKSVSMAGVTHGIVDEQN